MANFTPVSAAIGGALIGLSAVLLMLFTGRIAGISGIFDGLINPKTSDRAWRVAFAVSRGSRSLNAQRPPNQPLDASSRLYTSGNLGVPLAGDVGQCENKELMSCDQYPSSPTFSSSRSLRAP